MTNIRITTLLLFIFGLIHFLFYLATSNYNAFHSDDLQVMTVLRDNGISAFFESATEFEFPLVIPGHLIFFKTLSYFNKPSVINTFIYISNLSTCYLILTLISKNIKYNLIGSLLLISTLYLSVRACIGWGNVTYWCAAQFAYFCSLNYILLSLYLIVRYIENNNKITLVFLCISLFLTFNIKINATIIILIYIFGYLLFSKIKTQQLSQYFHSNRKSFLILITIVITSTIWLFGNPGNFKRLEIQGTSRINWNFLEYITLTFSGFLKYIITTIENIRLLMSAALISIYFSVIKYDMRLTFWVKKIHLHALMLFIAIFSQAAIIALLFKETVYSDSRFYFFIDIAVLIFLSCFFTHVIYKLKKTNFHYLPLILILSSICYLIKFDYRIFKFASKFSAIHTQNLELIKHQLSKDSIKEIFVRRNDNCFILGFPPLENKITRRIGDTSADCHSQNYKLEKFYKTKFRIYSD
jgi:hypothetical protein